MVIGVLALQAGPLHAEPVLDVPLETSTITLMANANASDWVSDEGQLSWSIALTDQNIVKAVAQHGAETYNQPTMPVSELNPYVVLRGVANGSSASVEVTSGVYDWIVLVDVNADEEADSYLGSLQEQIQLDQHHFEANKHYHIRIASDGSLHYQIK